MSKSKTIFYNIRVVKGKDKDDAWYQISDMNEFEESHDLCDTLHTEQELRDALFPNGFKSWQETHFHIVSAIARTPDDAYNKVTHIEAIQGQGGLWELAEELTNKFENKYKGVEWDGEYFDTINAFLDEELKTN